MPAKFHIAATAVGLSLFVWGCSGDAPDAPPPNTVVFPDASPPTIDAGTDHRARIDSADAAQTTPDVLATADGPAVEAAAEAPITENASIQIDKGADQAGFPAQVLELVEFTVAAAGVPVPNATVTLEADAGMAMNPMQPRTDASGRGRFKARLGLRLGTQKVRLRYGTAEANLSFTAKEPPAGTVFSILNVAKDRYGVPEEPATLPRDGAAATITPAGTPTAIATAPDGTIYYLDYPHCMVASISPEGVFRTLTKIDPRRFKAEGGVNVAVGCYPSGEGGKASSAVVDTGYGTVPSLALDVANKRLLVSAGDRIRAVDLVSGIITTFAGGGTSYGQDVVATDAHLELPRVLAVGPDGTAWISALPESLPSGIAKPARVVKVTKDGYLTTVPWESQASCDDTIALYPGAIPSGGTADEMGNLFIATTVCGQAVGGIVSGIVKIEPAGRMIHIAGRIGGPLDPTVTSEQAPATKVWFGSSQAKSLRHEGNTLYFYADVEFLAGAIYRRALVKKIDLTTGLMTTVAGAESGPGTSSDYVAAREMDFFHAAMEQSLARLPGGHFVIGDEKNPTNSAYGSGGRIRIIW